ncbi:cysteine hydrolase family protein [Lactococcus allomyrinae]|uniref:Cysteine hydrolase n=1 Tax=Lactococcus allomyrinae TaxID=2419773 RepID=A0A387B8E7_9LACT|nr:isochorismatase family protein [Lactococcus allomyrinae]AYG00085.1 cysteine hydrolase [Lactococcus allomyrinae]
MKLEHSALIVVDLNAAIQKIVSHPYPYSWVEIEANNRALMSYFLAENCPVFVTSVQPKILPKSWGKAFGRQLITDIAGVEEVIKFGPSIFTQSDAGLAEKLKAQGITKVFFSGISTSNGVFKSAKDAVAEQGFDVVLVRDATADRNASGYEKIIKDEFPKIGEIQTTVEILMKNER